jgi:hypothetical protein
MADLNEPKKETVRITLPPRPSKTPGVGGDSRETVRIKLPARPPSISFPARPGAPITILPKLDTSVIDSIPQSLCWALLALSAIVFIVQFLIYFS